MPLPYAERWSLHEAGVVLGGVAQFVNASMRAAAQRSATVEAPAAAGATVSMRELQVALGIASAAPGAPSTSTNATPNAASSFRLVVEFADGRVRVGREASSIVVAETAVGGVLLACAADGPVRRIVLQVGTIGVSPRYDALRVIPGERGGWSRTKWIDARVWDEEQLARTELLGVPPAPPPTYRGYAWQAVGSVGALLMLWFAAWMVLVR